VDGGPRLKISQKAGRAVANRSNSMRGRISPTVMARTIRNAMALFATTAGTRLRSADARGPMVTNSSSALAARNRKMPGIIETTAEKPTAAKGRRRRSTIGVTIRPASRQAKNAAVAVRV
jgi:hypothetical protein